MKPERSPLTQDAFSRLQAAEMATGAPRTRAEAEAGTYPKGQLDLHGMPITLENPRGSVRSGQSEDGKQWSNRMAAAYGEFDGTVGADGDPVDCFIGPFPESRRVWVINQGWPDGGFDEHKVMLGFVSEAQARAAYLGSFDRDWTGLQSIVPCSITQLKTWLSRGNTRALLSLDQLPFDGSTDMDKTLWTPDALPLNKALHQLLYELRVDDAGQNLLLDAVSMADITSDPDMQGAAVPMLDALVVEVNRLTQRMTQLQRVMDSAGSGVKPTRYTISDPVRARGVTMLAVLFEMSDGQAISVWFHNPDTTPNKLMPQDELISFRWTLNKKDVTIVVAPEKGKELSVREVARRIMRLVERNSAAFQKANAKAAEVIANEKAVDEEIGSLSARLGVLQHQIEVERERKVDAENAAAQLLADPTTREGYAAIKDDEAKLLYWQDTLDAFFQARIIEVRNALRELGWDGAAYQPLSKGEAKLQLDTVRVGGGSNVVGVTYRVKNGMGGEVGHVRDDLVGPAGDVAFQLDALLLTMPQPEPAAPAIDWDDAKPLHDFAPLAEMGTVTVHDAGGENVYFAKDGLPFYTKLLGGEFAVGQEIDLAALVAARQAEQNSPENAALDERYIALGDQLMKLSDDEVRLVAATSPLSLPRVERFDREDTMQKIMAHHPDDIEQALTNWRALSTPAAADPVAPAYDFANATDAFKEWVAPVGVDHDAFDTAKAMDEAAVTAGLSIAWDRTVELLLDSAAADKPEQPDHSALLDAVAAAAKQYLPEGAILDFAGDVTAAVVQLQIALETMTTNEPINRAEGKIEQADLERDNAEQFRAAIAILAAPPVLDDAGQKTEDDKSKEEGDDEGKPKPKEGDDAQAKETPPKKDDDDKSKGDEPKAGDDEDDDTDPEKEWEATPESDDEDDKVLDGDFPGHPFRGNQHAKSHESSGAAVSASKRAKHAERKGDAKTQKSSHASAHYSHKAAAVHASGKAKKYHETMAKFHGSRGGVLDAVEPSVPAQAAPVLDATASEQGKGVISKDGVVVGRAYVASNGYAMVYVGADGNDRVAGAKWAAGEGAAAQVQALAASLAQPAAAEPAGLAPIVPQTPDRAAWEGEVARHIIEIDAVSNGDAQAIMEGQPDTVDAQFAANASPADAARAILLAATPAGGTGEADPDADDGRLDRAGWEREVANVIRDRQGNATRAEAMELIIADGNEAKLEDLFAQGATPEQGADAIMPAPVAATGPVQELVDAGYTQVQSNDYASPAMPGDGGTTYRFNVRVTEAGFRVTMNVTLPGITGASKDVGTAADAAGALALVAQEYAAHAPAAEPSTTESAPAATDASAADRAYLESLLAGTGDILAQDTLARLEPMFTTYEGDADMMALLERVANASGEAALAAAATITPVA